MITWYWLKTGKIQICWQKWTLEWEAKLNTQDPQQVEVWANIWNPLETIVTSKHGQTPLSRFIPFSLRPPWENDGALFTLQMDFQLLIWIRNPRSFPSERPQ